ncbi:Hypothetical protein LEPBI_II0222 [Leptospira biflexa serovar Patoc strain 'Patoc 1 (Paris)']|uniref:Uncharacterized protein n=1 Tax=Leptospira biflexa serovar Patoc (strain Patoc 1 / ATCC 23582 / Paris) TaxID=456481 RepID=B0SU71_LEPBP|nr:Hypothetical protein LEPBI_II0222 [Leptospira biflexa serovar Patoc strain 'Patoc 1 (Paris)']
MKEPTTLNLQEYGAEYWYKVEDNLYIRIEIVLHENDFTWDIRNMSCDIDETN